jgi:hypothetical protein
MRRRGARQQPTGRRPSPWTLAGGESPGCEGVKGVTQRTHQVSRGDTTGGARQNDRRTRSHGGADSRQLFPAATRHGDTSHARRGFLNDGLQEKFAAERLPSRRSTVSGSNQLGGDLVPDVAAHRVERAPGGSLPAKPAPRHAELDATAHWSNSVEPVGEGEPAIHSLRPTCVCLYLGRPFLAFETPPPLWEASALPHRLCQRDKEALLYALVPRLCL